MQRNPPQATPETYDINISTFNDGQPKKFLVLLRKFKIVIDGTGTTMPTGRINYLRTIISGKSLRVFDKISLQGNRTNNHLKHIMEDLLEYFPLRMHFPSRSAQ